MKYAVRLEYIGRALVEIEAANTEEAHEKALEIGANMDAGDFSYDTEVIVYDSVIEEQ
jgi:hypothetical protein